MWRVASASLPTWHVTHVALYLSSGACVTDKLSQRVTDVTYVPIERRRPQRERLHDEARAVVGDLELLGEKQLSDVERRRVIVHQTDRAATGAVTCAQQGRAKKGRAKDN